MALLILATALLLLWSFPVPAAVPDQAAAPAQVCKAAPGSAAPQALGCCCCCNQPPPKPPIWSLAWWFDTPVTIFTAALVVVGALQVWFTGQALRESRKASDAATKAAESNERTIFAAERPWLLIENVHIVWRDELEAGIPNNWYFSVAFKNVGRSPAFLDKCLIKFARKEQLGDVPDYTEAQDIGVRPTLAPGAEFETRQFGPAPREPARTENPIQYVAFGALYYRDVLGRNHHTAFAFDIAPMFPASSYYPNDNYTSYT